MPKELYKFVEGERVWTYTSADENETYNGELYESVTMGRNEIENKSQLSRANIEVSFSLDNEMARRWMRQTTEVVVSLSLFVKADSGLVTVGWKGRLASVKPEQNAITLVFESIFTSLRRPGLRARYQRACRHVLYGRGCGLNKEDFAIPSEITAIDGITVTVPAAANYADGYFIGGMIEGPDGALRFITNHVGSTVVLIRELESLTDVFLNSGYGQKYGLAYGKPGCRLFPGCPRTRDVCHERFNNLPNFGGFPFIPLRNPFDGSSIV